MYLPKKIERQSLSDSPSSLSSSPFTEMTKSIMERSKNGVVNGSPPRVVANVVLQIAMAEKPNWRYPAGADAQRLFEARTKMSDTEFEKFLYELLGF
jgi:hypothetical protein